MAKTLTIDEFVRQAGKSPPWVRGFLLSLTMENAVIHGRPAMALSFVSSEVILQDFSGGQPVTLKSFALVEDADGSPSMAVDRSHPDALPDIRSAPIRRDLGDHAAGWCRGRSAWQMILAHHPPGTMHDLNNAKLLALSRISDLVSGHMEWSGFSEGFKRNLRLIESWTPAAAGAMRMFAEGPNADFLRALARESPVAGELLSEHPALVTIPRGSAPKSCPGSRAS